MFGSDAGEQRRPPGAAIATCLSCTPTKMSLVNPSARATPWVSGENCATLFPAQLALDLLSSSLRCGCDGRDRVSKN